MPCARDVRELAEEQLALLRGRIGDTRAARLHAQVAFASGVVVEADRVLLGQALANVLQNAVEAYPVDGDRTMDLRITAELPKGALMATIAIEDDGCGIDAAWKQNVGDPFLSTKGQGRGLGMLNVKKVVEAVHGGVVDIDSEVGRGTRVELILPRKQSTRARAVRKRKRAVPR